MHRAIPVGNKVCAARVRKRYEDQRAQRLRDTKSLIDNTPPHTTALRHLKHNYKRDEMEAQRHDTIERNDRLMLTKMHEFARKPEYSVPRVSSLPALRGTPGGPAQQREYDRIMQANALMLRRLRGAQPEIHARTLEESYKKSEQYVHIACEFPPPLLKRKGPRTSPSRSGLTRLPGRVPESRGSAVSRGSRNDDNLSEMPEVGGDLRYVLREEDHEISGAMYSVEMATDGCALAISIYNPEADSGLELLINEENHRALYHECSGSYQLIAQRLRIEEDQLLVAPLQESEWPPRSGGRESSVVDVDDEAEGHHSDGELLWRDEGNVNTAMAGFDSFPH